MDLLLAQTQPTYLPILQRYGQALRSRNALLKQASPNLEALESFSRELISAGSEITKFRRDLVPSFAPHARGACHRISSAAEDLSLSYIPNVKGDFAVALAQARSREIALRMTVVGPHRDDLQLTLGDRSVAQYGSEGQKRTVAIALKMAQAELLMAVHGVPPVLLIDDIMGELDARRRAGFLPLLEQAHKSRGQVFMTATEENWPRELAENATRWKVAGGALKRDAAA
jgi:DNA replication and repair protein RecF